MATVSIQQLAQIGDRHPSWFTLNRDRLPATRPVHDGTPALAFDLTDLAEFVCSATADLSDAACRLQVALHRAGKTNPERQP